MEKVVLVPLVFYLVGCIVSFALLEWVFCRKLSLSLDGKDHFVLFLFSLFSWVTVACTLSGLKIRKGSSLPYQSYLNPKRIWVLEQNKPSLVAEDLEKFYNVPREATHAILLARGVYKWLAVRRDLIRLKNEWKDELTRLQEEAKKYRRGSIERAKISARIRTLTECRQAIRKLCHSSRWQAPDNDKEAVLFLKRLEEADGFSGK